MARPIRRVRRWVKRGAEALVTGPLAAARAVPVASLRAQRRWVALVRGQALAALALQRVTVEVGADLWLAGLGAMLDRVEGRGRQAQAAGGASGAAKGAA